MSCCLLFCPLINDWRSQFTNRFIYHAALPCNQSCVSCLLHLIPVMLSNRLVSTKSCLNPPKTFIYRPIYKVWQKVKGNSCRIMNEYCKYSSEVTHHVAKLLSQHHEVNNKKRCQTSHQAIQTP